MEGTEAESIIASGIYYYDMENITESLLNFREAVELPVLSHNKKDWVRHTYGIEAHDSLNQGVGSIVAKEGRCIAFPNTYQHQVAPFSLRNKKKPGHRKIMVFFLVDPSTQRVMSTENVPPQRRDWLFDYLMNPIPVFPMLPSEIVAHIVNYMDWPMTLEEAKKHREELMKQRKYYIDQTTRTIFARPFSLCEH